MKFDLTDDQRFLKRGRKVYVFVEEYYSGGNNCNHCALADGSDFLCRDRASLIHCSKGTRKDKKDGYWATFRGTSPFNMVVKPRKKPVNKMTSDEKMIVDILL